MAATANKTDFHGMDLLAQRRRSQFYRNIVSYFILTIVAIVFIMPLVYTVSTSLKYPADAKSPSLDIVKNFIPSTVIKPWWYNYFGKAEMKLPNLDYDGAFYAGGSVSLFNIKGGPKLPNFGAYYINSVIVSLSVMIIQMITCSLAAYAFARLRWPGRDTVFLGYLGTMMVPGQVTMIPVFILFKNLGLVDTYFALILPGAFSAYGTFMLRQYFMSIPAALEEAAVIDGANRMQILIQIIIPLSKTALATLAILSFLWTWNDFMWPMIVINTDALKTLPIGLQAFNSQYTADFHLIMAASLIVLVPVIVVFIFGQKYITKGIMMTGIK
jgi:multiple sugar transport system permease protein